MVDLPAFTAKMGAAMIEAKPSSGAGQQISAEDKNRRQIASNIADDILELRGRAKKADLKFLVYFLEMAFQEAYTQANRALDENADKSDPIAKNGPSHKRKSS